MSPRPKIDDHITMKYGAGGRAMRALVESIFVANAPPDPEGVIGLSAMDDGAAIPVGDRFLVLTTDSHVVQPIFFPGGDIGRLAVSGTVNDLAMMGATEVLALTSAVIIEDGFSRFHLEAIERSMRQACLESGARILTGDTKLMGKGELDGVAITTSGVAFTDRVVRDSGLRPGDRIILTGTIGDHGFAVMKERNHLELDGDLRSDVAPINGLIRTVMRHFAKSITAMKDPTRGGVASALSEMAKKSGVGVVLEEGRIPLRQEVRAAAEVLGIDPLHVANEGKAVIGVCRDDADDVLEILREHPLGRHAAIAGTVIADHPGTIILDTGFGRRILPEPEGEILPRIC
jgi:hydrogenase expression/formation protein HypE